MPTSTSEVQDALAGIVEVLDAAGKHASPDDADNRGESRRLLRTPCELWRFNQQGRTEAGYGMVTRNFSFSGLSVVGSLNKPLRPGRPVEARIVMPDLTHRHVAGTVAFSRAVPDDCHEVGIHVLAVGSGWIIAGDIQASVAVYDWFAEALRVPE
ncbi:MAG: hypothetical protein ACE5HE_01480 [Phycisphaerae bacterium]